MMSRKRCWKSWFLTALNNGTDVAVKMYSVRIKTLPKSIIMHNDEGKTTTTRCVATCRYAAMIMWNGAWN